MLTILGDGANILVRRQGTFWVQLQVQDVLPNSGSVLVACKVNYSNKTISWFNLLFSSHIHVAAEDRQVSLIGEHYAAAPPATSSDCRVSLNLREVLSGEVLGCFPSNLSVCQYHLAECRTDLWKSLSTIRDKRSLAGLRMTGKCCTDWQNAA